MTDEKKKPEEETTPQGEQKSEQAESKPAEPPKEEPKTEGEEKTPDEKKPTLRLYIFASFNAGTKKELAIFSSP